MQTSEASEAPAGAGEKGRILVVDDDAIVRRSTVRVLRARGFRVESAERGQDAVALLGQAGEFDAILSDISMPGMDGIQLLRTVRERDLDVPVILMTGDPAIETAVKAVQFGAFQYLTKPVSVGDLEKAAEKATNMSRIARMKRAALELTGNAAAQAGDRAGLEASFGRAMDTLWMAYQPILRTSTHEVFGYEALLRSGEPSLPHPGAIIEAAERLGTLDLLGRKIRERAAEPMRGAPEKGALFVNLHPEDLLDETLGDPSAPLASIASQVVLEITERSSLEKIKDVKKRIATLREVGYRIAVDDLGAGYAGLTSFALLEPEIVKLDMTLVRDVHTTPTKQKLIRSLAGVCRDMGMLVVAEGIETVEERDALIELGCDLLQGYRFAKPGRAFPEASW